MTHRDIMQIQGALTVSGRLDRALADYCAASPEIPILSRTRIKSLIESGMLSLNDQIVTDPSAKIQTGANFCLNLPPPEMPLNRAENIALEIIYEDDELLVINKPPGMVVHPAPGHREGTLVNALIHHCGDSIMNVGGVARPGIVHRIDKDTSGLLVVAKNDHAYAHLQQQFSDHSIERSYSALVWGLVMPKQGTISHSIGRSPINRQKMAVVAKGGKKAITHYRRVDQWAGRVSLVECRLETGRTHQIRVHLTHCGYAIIGDPIYGRKPKINAIINRNKENNSGKVLLSDNSGSSRSINDEKTIMEKRQKLNEDQLTESALVALVNFDRQALHAAKLGFIHPKSGNYIEFNSKPPGDFTKLLESLNQLRVK